MFLFVVRVLHCVPLNLQFHSFTHPTPLQVCQEARELKYRSVLRCPPRPAAQLLVAHTEAPQIQLMNADSRPRGPLIRGWKPGGEAAAAGGSAAAAVLPGPREASVSHAGLVPKPDTGLVDAAAAGGVEAVDDLLRLSSQHIDLAVAAAQQIERQAERQQQQRHQGGE